MDDEKQENRNSSDTKEDSEQHPETQTRDHEPDTSSGGEPGLEKSEPTMTGPEEESQNEKTQPPPSLQEISEEALRVTREILRHFPKVKNPKITSRIEEGAVWVEIMGDPTGRLIGRKGQTIEAFQHILSKIISHRFRRKITVHVDAENYKRRHINKLRKLALQTADYVAKTKTARALEPMSAADRRIVHLALKDRKDVITASEGKNSNRFVVIWPREEEEPAND